MTPEPPPFRRGAVRPVVCLQEAWEFCRGRYWPVLGVVFLGMLIGGTVPVILTGPMICGIYLVLFDAERGGEVRFDKLWKGFELLGDSIVVELFKFIPQMVVVCSSMAVVVGVAVNDPALKGGGNQFPVRLFVAYGLLYVVIIGMAIVMQVAFTFCHPLVVEHRMKGIDAVLHGMKAALANAGGLFGLIVLELLLGFLGLFACFVGGLFLLPVTTVAGLIAYRQVFGPPVPAEVFD